MGGAAMLFVLVLIIVDYYVLSCWDVRNKSTVFLPLFPPKDTSFSSHRRLLQNSARMPLHDDLLFNGYYTTRLWIGAPPQRFALIVDTGSAVAYVPCSTCEQCGKHQDPRFQPDMSSSYQPVRCNIECTCDNEREQCIYERQYTEMSSSSGVLVEDIVSFGNQSELAPQRAVFGCENRKTGDLYCQHADGIMGLGRGDLSIVDQLVDKHVISNSFSLCYGGMDFGGGAMVLGGIKPPPEMVFTNSDPVRRKVIYIITTEELLDDFAFSLLFFGVTRCNVYFSDISQLSKAFPPVNMVFSDGKKLSLSPENYLFRHSKVHGAYCLGIFQNGKDATTLLGGISVRNTLVTYDREHERIGFWKTNCSELWDRLNLSPSPPPLPSSLDDTNSTINMTPTLIPSGSPGYNAPGKSKVGLVTFYMSLSVNYSDLKPHIMELTHFIAQDLDVNISQVHVMNFSTKGNDSLVRWAIFPAESANYIPNPAAMEIIQWFAENRLHLPDIFGSYKLFEWGIEPPPKRIFKQGRGLAVVDCIIVYTCSMEIKLLVKHSLEQIRMLTKK